MQEIVKGLVSIIIPYYKARGFITETINSILTQTYQDFEIILVNDGSNENDLENFLFANFPKVIFIDKTKNTGVSDTRNTGFKTTRGEFIVFLDADDILTTNFLERRIFTLKKSAAIACASNVVLVDKKGDEIEENKKHFAANKSSQILEFNDGIITCPSSYLFKTEFLKKHKITFNKNLQSSADKYFLLEVLKQGEIELINESPMYYRILNESMSHKITKPLVKDQIAFYYEIKKFLEDNNSVTNSYYSRLSFTIAASAYYSKEYYIFIKHLCKSFLLSPRTMILLLMK